MSYSKPSRSAPPLISIVLDPQRAHDLREDRDAARKHGLTILAEPRQLELLDSFGLDHCLDDGLERRQGDAAFEESELLRDVARGADRARRPDRAAPTEPPKNRGDRAQLEPCCEARAIETLLAQLAVAEMLLTQADAADSETLEVPRLVAFADDELGAAAADVDDEVRSFGRVRMVRYAEVDQPGLLHARNHLHGMAERFLGRAQECVGVTGTPQRVRADDSDLVSLHVSDPLAEAAQARERAALTRAVEIAVLAQGPDASRTISRSRSTIAGCP